MYATPALTNVRIGALLAAVTPVLLTVGLAAAHDDGSDRSLVVDHLASPQTCLVCADFNPQPDPPSFTRSPANSGIGDPGDRFANMGPGLRVGLGGPDTAPAQRN